MHSQNRHKLIHTVFYFSSSQYELYSLKKCYVGFQIFYSTPISSGPGESFNLRSEGKEKKFYVDGSLKECLPEPHSKENS